MANPHVHVLNIPLAISAQTVEVNLPELRGMSPKLSGPVPGIYSGKIGGKTASATARRCPGRQYRVV
jgi:phosphate transport system substrate-binding protein